MELLHIVVMLSVFSLIVATIASSKYDKSWFSWFLLSLAISPLVTFIILLFDRNKCPFCKEVIKEGASKCKHCGSELQNDVGIMNDENSELVNINCINCGELNSITGLNINNVLEKSECKKCGLNVLDMKYPHEIYDHLKQLRSPMSP